MSENYKTLLFEVDEHGIAVLTINRPDKLNALNNQVFEELDTAIAHIKNNAEIKGVIVTGAGDKAFVAGADIKEFSDFDSQQATSLSMRGHRIFAELENLTKPVLAAVNGFALGGGCELALACHLRLASATAKIGLPEVSLGLIPGYGGTQRLPELVGKAKALELIMSGRFIGAEEAVAIGLVNGIADEDLMVHAKKLMKSITKQGPIALKNAILAVKHAGTETGYSHEANLFGELFATADFKEGTTAFFEKRKPNFSGK
jgi:enoyl-CoA hydratase